MGIKRIGTWWRAKKMHVFLEFFVLALFIFYPLLKSGFVFALDLVFVPELRMPTWLFNDFILRSFFYFLNFVFPSSIIEKALLFVIVILSGAGMYRLVKTESEWPRYFAGILYIFNPFFYERLAAGQVFLLLGYAFMPWAIISAQKFFREPTLGRALKTGLWLGIIPLVSLHSVVFFGLFLTLYLLAEIVKNYKAGVSSRQVIKYFVIIIFACLVINSFWLLPSIFSTGSYVRSMGDIALDDNLGAFQSQPDPQFGLAFNLLSLFGFWGEGRGVFADLKAVQPLWPVISSVLFILALWGAVIQGRKNDSRGLAIVLFSLGLISFLLAMSTNFKVFYPLFNFSLLKVFREPQKFISLLVLAYAFFGAWALNDIFQRIKGKWGNIVISIFLILPLANTYILFAGLKGQLAPHEYPRSWYQVENILRTDKDNFKVLFFPWHSYLSFSFLDNKVINTPAQCPTNCFFSKPIISSHDMELLGTVSASNKIDKFVIDNVLNEQVGDLGGVMKSEGIKYIILAEEVDYEKYDFLERQPNLKEIYYEGELKLFINLLW